MSRILVGTCSWSQHTDFYPPGLPKIQQISYYARQFPIVEVDSSFYALVAERNYALWAERTPPDFRFDVKPYRQLTWHDRATPPDDEIFSMFRQSLQPLRDAGKLSAVTFQFPPWFTYRPSNLDYLARCREGLPDDRLSVEFRHRSWLDHDRVSDLLELLSEYRLAFTVVDEPRLGSGSVPMVLAVTAPELAIVRFHGRNYQTWYHKGETSAARFDYLYSDDELRDWTPNAYELARDAEEVHLLFNNNRANYAVVNARSLTAILQEAAPDQEIVTPVEDEQPEQPSLF